MFDSLWKFTVKDIDGQDLSLSKFEGKKLYDKYESQGLVVLGFPCNQFGCEEPGTDAEIKAFAQSKYNVTFPMFSKIEVNGANALPLYQYLKSDPAVGTHEIQWNFEKFLVNKQGKVMERGEEGKKPFEFEQAIVALLNE